MRAPDMLKALADWSATGHREDCRVCMCACHMGRGMPWFTYPAQVSGIIAASLLYDLHVPYYSVFVHALRGRHGSRPSRSARTLSSPHPIFGVCVRASPCSYYHCRQSLVRFPVSVGRMAPAQPASASCFGKACALWSSWHMTYVMCPPSMQTELKHACYPQIFQAVKCARHALTKR